MRRRWPITVPDVANARAKAERRGRNPAAMGSPGRRGSDATSVIVLLIFLPRPRADRVLRGGGVYPTGPVLARTAKSAFFSRIWPLERARRLPRFTCKGRPNRGSRPLAPRRMVL